MEAAGVALANIYGPKKYQDGLLKTGIRSIARGIATRCTTICCWYR